MEKEIWKDIPEYEGIYQVSNLGRIKSLSRAINCFNGVRIKKESIRVLMTDKDGYYRVDLNKNGKQKHRYVHGIVAEVFLNHKRINQKIVIDHINDIKTDNRVENLQIVTNRFNSYKTQGKYTSQYKGVHWCKRTKKWKSETRIDGKLNRLGYFTNEFEAHLAYQNKIKEIENG